MGFGDVAEIASADFLSQGVKEQKHSDVCLAQLLLDLLLNLVEKYRELYYT